MKAGRAGISIVQAMTDPDLFGRQFTPLALWRAWVVFLAALFGLPMTDVQAAIFRQHTGRVTPPTTPAREAWLVVGRRGGKSRIAALVAVFLACFRDYRRLLAAGERGVVMVLAADRDQAKVVFRYIAGLIDGVPLLASLVKNRTADEIELTNGITIQVLASNFRSLRGRTVVAAIADEIAFWRSDDSANPDKEVLNALRPSMATVPGALLVGLSSPYARRGVLWEANRDHFGRDGDPVLVWRGDTRSMNPAVPEAIIRHAEQDDPVAAAAEYGAEFRQDVETFLTRERLDAVVVPGRERLHPLSGVTYHAFVDPSGGSQDSMTFAIAHAELRDGQRVVLLDRIGEVRSPLSPYAVVSEFVLILKTYGIRQVLGDRYAGEWPREAFRQQGVFYQASEPTRSDLYQELLPLITGTRVELLDEPRLLRQLLALDRRPTASGRDVITHPGGTHDDLANAVAGAVVAAARPQYRLFAGSPSAAPAPAEHCSACGDWHPQGARCPAAAPTVAELRAGGYLYSY